MVEVNKPSVGQQTSVTPSSLTNNTADARAFVDQSNSLKSTSTTNPSNSFVANPTADNSRIALATQPTPPTKTDSSSKNNSKSDGSSAGGSGVQTAAGTVNSRTITSKNQEDKDGQQGKGSKKNSATSARNTSKSKSKIVTNETVDSEKKLVSKKGSYKTGYPNNRLRLIEKGKVLITALDLKAIYSLSDPLRINLNSWRMGHGMVA
jgi:hypothetical protein